jgi:hypothetical protein
VNEHRGKRTSGKWKFFILLAMEQRKEKLPKLRAFIEEAYSKKSCLCFFILYYTGENGMSLCGTTVQEKLG